MTEAIRHYDDDYEVNSDYEDDELPTSYLNGQTANGPSELTPATPTDKRPRPATDWLVLLTRGEHDTSATEDVEPPPPPVPEGMAQHIAPPAMRPTAYTRVSGGLRRLSALVVFLALLAVALSAVYTLLAATPWAATLISSQTPAQQDPTNQSAPRTVPVQPAPPNVAPPPAVRPALPPAAQPAQPVSTAIPGSAADLREKGNAAYRAGNFDQAIDLLDNSIQMDGGDAVTYYQIGLAYLAATGRDHAGDDAELAFRSAASLQPGWAAPYQMLAESLARRGFYQDAISPAQKAVDLDGSKADTWLTLARALDGAGRKSDALNAYAQAQKLAPAPPAKP